MKMDECCRNCYWNMVTKCGIICLHMDSDCVGDVVEAKSKCPLFEEWPECKDVKDNG